LSRGIAALLLLLAPCWPNLARAQPAPACHKAQGNRLQTVALDLGMVGPAALGRLAQTHWHRLVDADEPRDWGNQIHNEPGLLLATLENCLCASRLL
jgi:Uncharacterized protein conserved in bacteria (DUF2219)